MAESREKIAALYALASRKGYTVDRAYMREGWRLVDTEGGLAKNPRTKAATFSTGQAAKFLRDKRDRSRPA